MSRRIALVALLLVAGAAASRAAAQDRPRHGQGGGFPGDDCARCHATSGWERLKPAVHGFPHQATGFPLRGAHAALACDRCHDGAAGARGRTTCAACHADPHRGEQGGECERCHDERSFRAGSDALAKHRATRFPLTGAHALADCGACHLDREAGRFAALPTECVACHLRDFDAARAPDHRASGFSTACEDCHRPTSWAAARAFHDRIFPLTGAHASASCASCHPDGRYAGTPRDCGVCHAADYAGTTNPAHASAGFGTSCQDCHSTRAWTPAHFDHARVFALTGAHASASCASCHPNGRYAGTPRDCGVCHAADYAGTTNPPHASAGFGTSCQDCHSTRGFTPATFDHERFFPIQTGAHSRFRNDCGQCHPQPASYAVFDCLRCHEQNKMDDKHRGRSGYVYASDACLRCHPRGEED